MKRILLIISLISSLSTTVASAHSGVPIPPPPSPGTFMFQCGDGPGSVIVSGQIVNDTSVALFGFSPEDIVNGKGTGGITDDGLAQVAPGTATYACMDKTTTPPTPVTCGTSQCCGNCAASGTPQNPIDNCKNCCKTIWSNNSTQKIACCSAQCGLIQGC